MKIDRIKLENFKCFLDSELNLNKLTFLVGLNSVGKSSVLQSILLPLQSVHKKNIELNGSLVGVGDYNDVLNIHAPDDSIRITIDIDNETYTWGYKKGHISNGLQEAELPLLTGKSHKIHSIKNNFQYISAERWGPRDNVPVMKKYRHGWLGKNGENVIDYLFSLANENSNSKDFSLKINDPRIHSEAKSLTILSSIEAWLGEISPGVNFDVNVYREANIGWSLFGYEGDSKKFRASNIGFGISYSLSIISAIIGAKKGDILIIENPEAHIHPRGQSQLGRLLALASHAGIQVLVETHSEHIINGARVAIRINKVNHEDVIIFYFDKSKNSSSPQITEIKPDQRATLSKWPEGFFDQTVIDMEKIIKG
ncbi:DUF3696 domain-containing protein [Pantoea sp. X85]|uniref:AAA family ATPase n=1 Tax=Pantoea sp. X85 TaxID=3037258 RepID=UPI002413C6E6|nr:DUF3696 domain-containing protein [Pantoea sp. X85]WFL68497.1 DUF3696 domain-containing protein [Pantoea sp. X85]